MKLTIEELKAIAVAESDYDRASAMAEEGELSDTLGAAALRLGELFERAVKEGVEE